MTSTDETGTEFFAATDWEYEMKQIVCALIIALAFATGAQAKNSRIDRSLDHLDPATRLEQLCAIETMNRVKKDGKPYRPDRAITYALSKPVLSGHTMSGQGGAFRSKGKWYQYSFSCSATADHMKVSTFTYKIGDPIPEDQWESHGLYR